MKAKEIHFPQIKDYRGNLSFIESGRQIPFEIKRVFYVYDIPSASERGAHAHKKLHQCILPLSGSFEVLVDYGSSSEVRTMSSPSIGLHIPPYCWSSQRNFSAGCAYIVLASDYYIEDDYIRDYDQFKSQVLA